MSAGKRAAERVDGVLIAALAFSWIVLAAYLASLALGGTAARYPSLVAPLLLFPLSLAAIPTIRPRSMHPISPFNAALFLFGWQLIGIPALLLVAPPAVGVLPHLPSDRTMNDAVLLQCVAYVGFIVGCVAWSHRHASSQNDDETRSSRRPARPSPALIVAFGVIGCVAVLLRFGSADAIVDYFTGAHQATGESLTATASAAATVGRILLPFFGVAVVMLFCRRIDAAPQRQTVTVYALARYIVLLLALVAVYSVYNYNRGAAVMPLLAIGAALSIRRRRLGMRVVAALGMPLAVLLLIMGEVRSAYLGEATSNGSPSATGGAVTSLEVYGQGPQFLGYLLAASPSDRELTGGRGMLASALSPVPILGEPFRATSSTQLYNALIYGRGASSDQIVPVIGELFWDFHIPGVVIGFASLGIAIAFLSDRCQRADSALSAYTYSYIGFWTSFLVIASISVLTQILLYFVLPLLLGVLLTRWPVGLRRTAACV